MNISLSSWGRCAWTVLISALSCGLTPALVEAGSFPATIDLHNLRSIGFRIDGRIPGEALGASVAGAGDVNGDHISDLIVGAPGADWNGLTDSGSAYVIFGKSAPFPTHFNISKLRRGDGFRLDGARYGDHASAWVARAGDVNGDGLGDMLISAPSAIPHGYNSGSAYVVFGQGSGFPRALNLSDLTSTSGYRIDGAYTSYIGQVSAAGDVNDDGIGDIIIAGHPSFVVFGRTDKITHPIRPSDLEGTNGFRLPSRKFSRVSGIGDINDDGIDDIIVATYVDKDPFTYVVFGRATGFPADVDPSTLDGTNGFRLNTAFDASGLGDVNGDGIADFIISGNSEIFQSAYVVFGRATGFPSDLDVSTLDGTNGFRFDASSMEFVAGVARARDVNRDGKSDIMITTDQGNAYVLFGRKSFPAVINHSSLDGDNGFHIVGDPNEGIGFFLDSAGDINADGAADLILGAPGAEYGGDRTGSAYVIYGRP